jgi:hypothetical protein
MIGFITQTETAAAVLDGVKQAMLSRGLPHFWSPGAYPVHAGPHAGSMFIPAGEVILNCPLIGNPVQCPTDFPEFAQIVATLGGLDYRVEIEPSDILDPDSLAP